MTDDATPAGPDAPASPQAPTGLHAAQQHVFDNRGRFTVIAAGRRFGKTWLSVKLAAYYARMTHTPDGRSLAGANVWYISPTMDLATETVAPLLLDELGAECVKYHKVQQYMQLTNGCRIYLKSANRPENLRGRALRYAVLDEISVMQPSIWDLVVRPMLVDYAPLSGALIIGTPVSRGKLYELHSHAKADKSGEWRSFTYVTTDNPLISRDEVQSAASMLSDSAYRQEFLADFSTGGGHIFKARQLQAGGIERGVNQMAVIFGSDENLESDALATSGTESAIIVAAMHPQGWTVKTAQTGYWGATETVKRIAKLYKSARPRYLAISDKDHKASAGAFKDFERRERVQLRRAIVDEVDTVDRVKWALQDRLKSRRLWCVKGKGLTTLRNQLQDFPLEYANAELVRALAYLDQLPLPSFRKSERRYFKPLDRVAGY